MTDTIETPENVFEVKAAKIVKKQYGLFGFDLVLAPAKERAAIKVVAAALEAERLEERAECAKIADLYANAATLHSPALMTARVIAAAIRSRETDNG